MIILAGTMQFIKPSLPNLPSASGRLSPIRFSILGKLDSRTAYSRLTALKPRD